MKNFDEARTARPSLPVEDRTFQLGGETFVMRDVLHPEVFVPLETLKEAQQSKTECRCGHQRIQHDQGAGKCGDPSCTCDEFFGKVLERGASIGDTMKAFDRVILDAVEGDGEVKDRWAKVRSIDAVPPVTIDDVGDVVNWMMEAQTRRPTVPPAGSSDGRSSTGTSSTGTSSSTESPEEQAA